MRTKANFIQGARPGDKIVLCLLRQFGIQYSLFAYIKSPEKPMDSSILDPRSHRKGMMLRAIEYGTDKLSRVELQDTT